MKRKYSKKGLERRKEERGCLPEFFKKHVGIAKTMFCEECGDKLKGDVSEIAHVLPKSYFKSIQCNDLNILYLCGKNSNNQCHTNYDNFPQEKLRQMKIYDKVKLIFKKLKECITENLNYKLTDKYES